MLKKILGIVIISTIAIPSSYARNQIDIVGSSTVYPFTILVAEKFGKTEKFKTPKVESTGTGGGFKLFCAGVGLKYPDFTNASRAIKESEIELCKENGVGNITEAKIGYDGLVIANAKSAPALALSKKDIYLALAKEIPNPDKSQTFVKNPYQKWNQINPKFPNVAIEVLGPPPTSGTRDSFVELVFEPACTGYSWIKDLEKKDNKLFKSKCHTIREDGLYIEAGENDNLMVQKIVSNKNAFAIFGFSFLDNNADKIQGALIDGVKPDMDTIASGAYTISRPLFFYIKNAHVKVIPGMQSFINEYVSDKASGKDGYLSERGLISLTKSERDVLMPKIKGLSNIVTDKSPSAKK